MDVDQLEEWSLRAVQSLQEIVDEAQAASGNPDGDDQSIDLRLLIEEHSRICSGMPTWQMLLKEKQ